MSEAGEVTQLLRAYQAGDAEAFNRLVPLIYEELRRIARRQLRRGPAGPSLGATGLVHEAYLKLAGAGEIGAADQGHLLAVAATAMRQVLIDRARARLRAKRGGGQAAEGLDASDVPASPPSEWLVDLDRALSLLRARDARLAQVFECRFFAGLNEEETAQGLGVSVRTAQRDWMRARAWLRAELESSRGTGRA